MVTVALHRVYSPIPREEDSPIKANRRHPNLAQSSWSSTFLHFHHLYAASICIPLHCVKGFYKEIFGVPPWGIGDGWLRDVVRKC